MNGDRLAVTSVAIRIRCLFVAIRIRCVARSISLACMHEPSTYDPFNVTPHYAHSMFVAPVALFTHGMHEFGCPHCARREFHSHGPTEIHSTCCTRLRQSFFSGHVRLSVCSSSVCSLSVMCMLVVFAGSGSGRNSNSNSGSGLVVSGRNSNSGSDPVHACMRFEANEQDYE